MEQCKKDCCLEDWLWRVKETEKIIIVCLSVFGRWRVVVRKLLHTSGRDGVLRRHHRCIGLQQAFMECYRKTGKARKSRASCTTQLPFRETGKIWLEVTICESEGVACAQVVWRGEVDAATCHVRCEVEMRVEVAHKLGEKRTHVYFFAVGCNFHGSKDVVAKVLVRKSMHHRVPANKCKKVSCDSFCALWVLITLEA